MNSRPRIRAVFLSRFFLISRLVFPKYGDISSDVAKRMIAITASQIFMSQKDRGNCIFYSLSPFHTSNVCFLCAILCSMFVYHIIVSTLTSSEQISFLKSPDVWLKISGKLVLSARSPDCLGLLGHRGKKSRLKLL